MLIFAYSPSTASCFQAKAVQAKMEVLLFLAGNKLTAQLCSGLALSSAAFCQFDALHERELCRKGKRIKIIRYVSRAISQWVLQCTVGGGGGCRLCRTIWAAQVFGFDLACPGPRPALHSRIVMCESFAFRLQFKWLNCPTGGGEGSGGGCE